MSLNSVLALRFLDGVWGPAHDLDLIDDLMTHDYLLVSGGVTIRGRPAFKAWVATFQRQLGGGLTKSLDIVESPEGTVVSRWICTGRNCGVFGLAPDNQEISFTGISIWRTRGMRLAACWSERSGLELYRSLTGPVGASSGEPAC